MVAVACLLCSKVPLTDSELVAFARAIMRADYRQEEVTPKGLDSGLIDKLNSLGLLRDGKLAFVEFGEFGETVNVDFPLYTVAGGLNA